MNTAMHLTLFIIIFVKFRKLQKKIITYKTFPKYISCFWLVPGKVTEHEPQAFQICLCFVLLQDNMYLTDWIMTYFLITGSLGPSAVSFAAWITLSPPLGSHCVVFQPLSASYFSFPCWSFKLLKKTIWITCAFSNKK